MKKKYEHSKIWYVLNYRYYSVRIFCAWFFGMLIATVIFSDTLYNFMYCTKFGVILSLLISLYFTIQMTPGAFTRGKKKYEKNHEKYLKKLRESENEITRPSLIGSFIGSAIRSSNRRSDAFQRGMSDAIYKSFSSSDAREEDYREQRRQADQRARARWDAVDRQKKAEWDAKDAALRGKDRAAYKYKNQADYWKNQSKKY